MENNFSLNQKDPFGNDLFGELFDSELDFKLSDFDHRETDLKSIEEDLKYFLDDLDLLI